MSLVNADTPAKVISLDRDTIYYLAIVFAVSYPLEIFIAYSFISGDYITANVLLVVLVFVPSITAGVLINYVRQEDTHYYGIQIGKLNDFPIAYLYPLLTIFTSALLLTILGFPVDWGMNEFKNRIIQSALQYNVSPRAYYINYLLASLMAPIFNAFFAIGEEAGWRGYLFTKVFDRNGLEKTILFTGTIWALWHAPLIAIAGYNYPAIKGWGLVLFVPFCIAHGTIFIWLRVRSGGIVLPSLAHGSLNAFWWLSNALYPNAPDALHILVGIPGIIVASVIALYLYWDLKSELRDLIRAEDEEVKVEV